MKTIQGTPDQTDIEKEASSLLFNIGATGKDIDTYRLEIAKYEATVSNSAVELNAVKERVARLIDKAIIGIVENKFPGLSLSNINMVSLPLDDADQNGEGEYSAIINVPISNPGVVPLVISDSPLRNFSISMSIYTDFLKLVVSGSVKGLLIQGLQVEKKSI